MIAFGIKAAIFPLFFWRLPIIRPVFWSRPSLLAVLTVGMGIAVEPLFGLVQSAADQLLTRTAYITAVLGTVPALPPVIAVESN